MRNLIRKMDSGTRMIAMLSLNLVLFLATSASGIYFLDSIKTEIHDIATQDLPITKALTGVTTHQLEQAVLVERVARLADARSGHVLELRRESAEEFKKLTAKVNKEFHEVEQITERAITEAHTDADKAEFRHLLELMKKADVEHQGFTKHAAEMFSQIESGRLAGLEERIETIEQEADKLDHELEAQQGQGNVQENRCQPARPVVPDGQGPPGPIAQPPPAQPAGPEEFAAHLRYQRC